MGLAYGTAGIFRIATPLFGKFVAEYGPMFKSTCFTLIMSLICSILCCICTVSVLHYYSYNHAHVPVKAKWAQLFQIKLFPSSSQLVQPMKESRSEPSWPCPS